MEISDFYREIEHASIPWQDYTLHVPVFYPDFRFISAAFLFPLEKARGLMPSKRLKPYRVSPWHSTLSITAYQYRDSDLGPYNEVGIGIPVTIDQETPLFTGSLHRMPDEAMAYIHHLPVTTEIARAVGVDFAGYPKFLADIEFRDQGDWLTCDLKAENQAILKLSGRKLPLCPSQRSHIHPLTSRRGYILRSEFILSGCDQGSSKGGADVKLELGEHPIAREMKELNIGKAMMYSYCPQAQGILTPVLESYKEG
jgi:hypothetical protein